MKKRILGVLTVVLALSMVLSMVSCDTGTTPNPPATGEPVTISYDANGWSGSGVPTQNGSGKIGTALTAAQLPNLSAYNSTTQIFQGWSYSASGALVTTAAADAPKELTVTLYVIWATPAAEGTTVTIKYDANGWTGSGVPSTDEEGEVGKAYTAAQLPTLEDTATQLFKGWSDTLTGKTPLTTESKPLLATVTLYVIWDPVGGVTTNDNAELGSLTLNDEPVVNPGAGGDNYAAAAAGSALVLDKNVRVAATPENPNATVQYAQVTGTEEPDFWFDTEFTFATGDFLAIEITATDGTTKKYYKIAITVADVALQSLAIGDTTVTLRTPTTTWQAARASTVLFDSPISTQPAGGLAVTATLAAASEGAVIQYGHATGTNAPEFSDTSTITFANGEYLYIKVSKEGNDAYYKVRVNFQMEGIIKYGSPEIRDNYIDPKWDDPELQIYYIEKAYLTDFSDAGLDLWGVDNAEGKIATGEAKALWDEEGLTVYVKVTDPEVSQQEKTGSEAHETDSVELFVNEGYPNTNYGQGGSQYRVGANKGRSGEGDGQTVFQAAPDNWSSAWKTDDGYIVIFKAPWRLRNRFPITDGKQIGFELQINDAPAIGQRHAVTVWNNVAHTNYQNATDYGIAKLDATGITLNFPAVPPTFSAQPQGTEVAKGGSITLSVGATAADGGTLSYQWYSATDGTGAGGEVIDGATSASYEFTAPSTEGLYFYYVVVTNTFNNTTETARSAIAAVSVSSGSAGEETWEDKITMVNTSVPVYGFNLPAGKTFGDYTKIVLKMKFDADSPAKNARLRAWGNYDLTSWTDVDQRPGMDNNGNGKLLSTGGEVDYTAVTDWTEYTIEFTNRDAALNADKTASGIIALGIGAVPPGGGSGTRVFYFKDIVLSNADGSETVPALKPDSVLLWAGAGASAYVTQDPANDSVTRELTSTTVAAASWEDKITMVNTSVPVYGFNLPAGKTFGDYTKIVLKMKFDADSPAKNARLRAWGNYDLTSWTDVDQRPGMDNNGNGKLLSTGGEVDYTAVTDWTEYTIEFTNRDAALNADKTASGIIALGIGAVPPGGGSGTRIFYFKDIVLSNADGSETVPALKPDSVLLWAGSGASAYVTQDPANDSVTRELQ